MLFVTLILSLLAITTYAAPAGSNRSRSNGKAVAKKASIVYPKVRWNTEFPEVMLGGSEIDLDWEGGSGKYELYYIPMIPGPERPEMLEHVPITKTTNKQMKWKLPELSQYPDHTTMILIIRDAKPAPLSKRAGQFDASRNVELVDTDVYRKFHHARRAM